MVHFFQCLVRPSKAIPDVVLVELINILFAPLVPTIVMGVTVLGIGALITVIERDVAVGVITIAIVLTSILQVMLTLAYRHRNHASPIALDEAKVWENRCAILCFVFAILLGALCARALMADAPLVAMLTTGLVFGYGGGLVARRAVRPVICVTSLVLATVPTIIGFSMNLCGSGGLYATAAYAAQTLLVAGFTVAGMESVAHGYQTALKQLLTKRDLGILAGQDALTGLPNRIELRTRFNAGIDRIERTETLLAFHCLDLDRFKAINDTFGHPTGDQLLQAVAKRLARSLQAGDTVARLGGDEFAVVQIGIRHPDEARLLARRIIRIVSEPYCLGGQDVRIGVSIGIALSPRDGLDLEHLAACADAALYQAKREGCGSVLVWGELPPLTSLKVA